MNPAAARSFEQSFLSASLSKQIDDCDSYELGPLFLELFSRSQPVLEAGCGSGRWCGWLLRHGIAADGIDWSSALCERASLEIPASRFYVSDMRNSGLPGGAYGGLIALGSIEHTVDGPRKALDEFYRLLRPKGVAVITVPYGGWLRIACRALRSPFEVARGSRLVRHIMGKPQLQADARSLSVARQGTVRAWHPRFALGTEGWSFYEYEFKQPQIEDFVAAAGFLVRQRFIAFVDEGLLHTFGGLAASWNRDQARVELTVIGRVLRRLLPVSVVGHMLCYVVQKPDR